MNIRKIISSLLLILVTIVIHAQCVDVTVIQKYSPSIVNALCENYTSKIKLNAQTQLWLANQLQEKDNKILLFSSSPLFTAAKFATYKDSLNAVMEERILEYFKDAEKTSYLEKIYKQQATVYPIYKGIYYANAEMNSIFGLAFKFRDGIKLSDAQIDQVLNAAIVLKTNNDLYTNNMDSGFFDRPAFESKQMSAVINDTQYNRLIADKNKEICNRQAYNDWYMLKKVGLDKKYEKNKVLQHLKVYYMLKAHLTERFAHEKERRALFLKSLRVPPYLKEANILNKENELKQKNYAW